MRFEIERQDADRLTRRVWTFALHSEWNSATVHPRIVLIRYCSETRQSTRHKWRRDERDPIYSSNQTSDDWRYGKYMPQDQVPMPDDVRADAIKFITDRLVIDIPRGHYERQTEENERYRHRFHKD